MKGKLIIDDDLIIEKATAVETAIENFCKNEEKPLESEIEDINAMNSDYINVLKELLENLNRKHGDYRKKAKEISELSISFVEELQRIDSGMASDIGKKKEAM